VSATFNFDSTFAWKQPDLGMTNPRKLKW